jgi:hypothetical protein
MGGMGAGAGMGGGASLNQGAGAGAGADMLDLIYKTYEGRGFGYPEGLHVHQLMALMRTKGINLAQEQVMQHVRQLCDDGKLYTTLDDDHHKPTCEDF